MKAFTDIEQSRKLAGILSTESADMRYPYFVGGQYGTTALFGEPIEFSEGKDVPCWSLAALLDVLPETIEDECTEYELEIDMIDKKPKYVWLGDCYHCDFPSWDWDNKELLDNIVEAVIWLNNNGYLRHEKLY